MARTILVTGAAGFIGAALSQRLLQQETGCRLDNLNHYYDLLEASEVASDRGGRPAGWFTRGNGLGRRRCPDGIVCCREADSGGQRLPSRGSLLPENPAAYIQGNLVGFGHLLKVAAITALRTLLCSSSSCMAVTVICLSMSSSR